MHSSGPRPEKQEQLKTMNPEIISMKEKKLVGMHMTMSFENNRTRELWRMFMPRKNEIGHSLSEDLVSLQEYELTQLHAINPEKNFEKWAAIEVEEFDEIPVGMEGMVVPAGTYAVFEYRGLSSDNTIFREIFGNWLPHSAYVLDYRPHFEILGENYKNNDPDSEEQIWIPVIPK